MSDAGSVRKLDLKKTEGLTVHFADGRTVTLSLRTLRTHCPCASCRQNRRTTARPRSLNVLQGDFRGEIVITNAHLVGNYAIQLEWSDGHAAGIYSFDYLRELAG
ncbi:MAG: DUF971 domain-containing protein [Phycisphaerae bacterium]|nr:DUF971 domain-containing protein [Phycisphaerae bacterium]MDW8263451.1 DUF971 domain-containing protein [Phycisphaerales bacterium]